MVWVGLRDIPQGRVPAGGEFIVPHKVLQQYKADLEWILKRQDDGPSIGGAEVLKLALEETYIPFARMMMKALPEIVEEFGPDLIINDCISFAGAICAYKMGIPYVTTTPVPPDVMGSAMEMPKIREWQEGLILGLQREWGICVDFPIIHSDRMNIVFTSREFAGMAEPPDVMHFVGPVRGRPDEGSFDWDRLDRAEGPKVFVSLGTLLVDIRKAYFQKVVEAFAGEPVTVVAATDVATLPEWPDNFIVQPKVPQLALLRLRTAPRGIARALRT